MAPCPRCWRCRVKRSIKQRKREQLTADQVRTREARKHTEALRALYVMQGGTVAWKRYLDQCRKARNARVRAHTAAILAAKRAALEAEPQQGLWAA